MEKIEAIRPCLVSVNVGTMALLIVQDHTCHRVHILKTLWWFERWCVLCYAATWLAGTALPYLLLLPLVPELRSVLPCVVFSIFSRHSRGLSLLLCSEHSLLLAWRELILCVSDNTSLTQPTLAPSSLYCFISDQRPVSYAVTVPAPKICQTCINSRFSIQFRWILNFFHPLLIDLPKPLILQRFHSLWFQRIEGPFHSRPKSSPVLRIL